MHLVSLKLTNYRNHKKLNLQFDAQLNLIVGQNGAGKTNILEAINVLSTTKSFRAFYDRDLINHNEPFCTIKAAVQKTDGVDDLELQVVKSAIFENSSTKRVKINGVPKTLSKFTAIFSAVLFSPESIEIVSGSPTERRKYLDSILFQVDAKYKKAASDYTKVIRQRNKLLEQISEFGRGQDGLEFWDSKAVELGQYIQEKRESLIRDLERFVHSLPKNNVLHIKYKKSPINHERLKEYKEKEIAAKSTLIGPHREDLSIFSNELDLAQFGSRGQQRDAVFSLKLAEMNYLQQILDEKPVLLLDDIFSEFDERHKQRVIELTKSHQTIITSATPEIASDLTFDHIVNLE